MRITIWSDDEFSRSSIVRDPGERSSPLKLFLLDRQRSWPHFCDRLAREAGGGANRDRTGDLRLAKPALSQLSYCPIFVTPELQAWTEYVVGQGRLELPTSRLSGVRSNHLSYWPSRPLLPFFWSGDGTFCRIQEHTTADRRALETESNELL